MHRRTFLAMGAAGTAALAGCAGILEDDSSDIPTTEVDFGSMVAFDNGVTLVADEPRHQSDEEISDSPDDGNVFVFVAAAAYNASSGERGAPAVDAFELDAGGSTVSPDTTGQDGEYEARSLEGMTSEAGWLRYEVSEGALEETTEVYCEYETEEGTGGCRWFESGE